MSTGERLTRAPRGAGVGQILVLPRSTTRGVRTDTIYSQPVSVHLPDLPSMTAAAASASASAAAAAVPRANFTPPPPLGRGHRPSALRKSLPATATATAGPSKRPALGCSKCRFNRSRGCAACGGSSASKKPTTPLRAKLQTKRGVAG